MKSAIILASLLALTACGGGGMTPSPIPSTAPQSTNAIPPRNGQSFALNPCVPVYDNIAGQAQVGTACGAVAPPASVPQGQAGGWYVVNGATNIPCVANTTTSAPNIIIGFACDGNPYHPPTPAPSPGV